MVEKKATWMPIVTAVLFLLTAFSQLTILQYGFFAPILLSSGVYVFCAVVLFMQRRDILLTIAVCAYGFLSLLALFSVRGILVFLPNLIALAANLLLIGFVLCNTVEQFSTYREKLKQFWFLPGALMALRLVFFLFITGQFAGGLLDVAVCLLLGLWILLPQGVSSMSQTPGGTTVTLTEAGSEETAQGGATYTKTTPAGTAAEGDGFCDLVKHILLLLFTFGIWYYIWIYRTTDYLNRDGAEAPRTPVNQLLLCMFVPFYLVYWIYKSAQRMDRLANAGGVQSDLTMICVVLAIFVGIIPPILIQEKINALALAKQSPSAPRQGAAPQTPTTLRAPAAPTVTLGIAEELKTYKELLDGGVITQEDFDAKKKELLGQ